MYSFKEFPKLLPVFVIFSLVVCGVSKGNKLLWRKQQMQKAYAAALTKEVVIFKISAQGLPNADFWNKKPDPFVIMSYRNGSSPTYVQFGRTDTLMDNSDPTWKDFYIFHDYIRGARQILRFEFRDHDQADWDDQIGYAFINVDDCLWESRNRPTEEGACQAQIQVGKGILFFAVV